MSKKHAVMGTTIYGSNHGRRAGPVVSKPQGLKSVPSVVQLPGGVKLQAIAFKLIDVNPDGSPKTFELLPPNTTAGGPGIWWLFADAQAIRKPVPGS
jgi:hypothetical protein